MLDQFSRNIYRDSAEAFAADPLAVELCRLAIERGWESRYATEERAFLYMPLMHAEDIALQRLSVMKFAELGGDNLPFAIGHLEVIARFGHFPTRNDALGRETTRMDRQRRKAASRARPSGYLPSNTAGRFSSSAATPSR